MKFKQSRLLLLLLTVILTVTACKKNEIVVSPNQSDDKQIIEQFTKIPKGFSPVLQKIADKLKEIDAQTPFIAKVSNKAGMPLWKKAQFKSKHTSNVAAREMLEGEQTVLIPLSVPNSNEVDGFIAAVVDINGDVKSVTEFDKYNYYLLGFNKPNTDIDAEDVAMQILILQKEVFGGAKFKIIDNKLFNSQDGSTAARKNFEIALSETPSTATSNSRVIVVKHNHCTNHTGTGPNGTDDDPDCDQCDNCGLFSYDIIFFDSPFDWGGGGGIGGGESGGGGGWLPPPPVVLTTSNIWQNIGLTSYQQSFVNNYANQTTINKLAVLMNNENFTEEAKDAARAVIDAMQYNEINGPYTHQAFLNIISDLSTNSVTVGSVGYWELFNNQQAEIAATNPTLNDYEVYFLATFGTNKIFDVDGDIRDDAYTYTTTNYDNAVYTPYDIQNPPYTWGDYSNVLPYSSFVGYDPSDIRYNDCLKVAKARLAKMGYSISEYGATGQTITCYKRKKDSNGNYVEGDYDDNAVKTGIDYLQKALAAGKPVIVGVECKGRLESGNSTDKTTDHFVIINGSGTDANGNHYFTYVETDTKDMNKSYFNPKTGEPYKFWVVPGVGLISDCNTPGCDWGKKVTQIRKTKP